MKINFFFLHGWGFDKDFWNPVGNLISKEVFSNSVKYLDLGFFYQKELIKNYNPSQKNIFIVHSLGLNWFLKMNIECYALINFFSAPSFLNFQIDSEKKRRYLKKMILKFEKNPQLVLSEFYFNCGIKKKLYQNHKKKNVKNLKSFLIDLYEDNLLNDFIKKDFEIFSFFSENDKIFQPCKKTILDLNRKNHTVKFFKDFNHAFPFTNPKRTFLLIKSIVNKLI